MSIEGIIGMVLILGIVVGGFLYFISRAMKKESKK